MATVKKARELLGDTANDMSDEDAKKVTTYLYNFAHFILDTYKNMSPEDKKKFSKKEREKSSRV